MLLCALNLCPPSQHSAFLFVTTQPDGDWLRFGIPANCDLMTLSTPKAKTINQPTKSQTEARQFTSTIGACHQGTGRVDIAKSHHQLQNPSRVNTTQQLVWVTKPTNTATPQQGPHVPTTTPPPTKSSHQRKNRPPFHQTPPNFVQNCIHLTSCGIERERGGEISATHPGRWRHGGRTRPWR